MQLPSPSATAAKEMFSTASHPEQASPAGLHTATMLAFWNHFF